MFNRITTLALATISTQAVKLLSQVDAEADAELGFGGAAFGVCLFNPNPPPECGHGLAQVEAEAVAELEFGPAAAWGALCLSNPNPPAECGFGLAQVDMAPPIPHHVLMHMWCERRPNDA